MIFLKDTRFAGDVQSLLAGAKFTGGTHCKGVAVRDSASEALALRLNHVLIKQHDFPSWLSTRAQGRARTFAGDN